MENNNTFSGVAKPPIDAEGKPQPIVIQQLTVRPINRRSQDIGTWRSAMQSAEATNPRRVELYDLYEDILLDGHLRSVVDKRIMAVTNVDWVFLDKDGTEVDFMKDWIDTPDFELLVSEILQSKLWGYTMLEFDFYKEGGVGVFLIPRKHMRPELGMVSVEQTANFGMSVREGIYANTILEAGKEKDLGLLLTAAQYVIYKRGNFGDWAQFSEMFGMPLIDAVWDGYDENQRLMLLKALDEMGSGGQMVRPAGTQLQFIQGGSNNPTGDLYNNFINACNAEISKLILGQTETTESSASSGYAQASVHAETESDINKADRNFVRRILNRRLINMLEANGIDTMEGSFEIKNNDEQLSIKDKFEMELRLKNEGLLPISDDHFYETYGIEKPENYDELKKDMLAKQAARQFGGGGFNMQLKQALLELKEDGFFLKAPKAKGAKTISLKEFYGLNDCCASHSSIALADTTTGDESFMKELFNGNLKAGQVPNIYQGIAETLAKAIVKGLGGDGFAATDYRNTLKAHLMHNVYAFSIAKSLTVMEEMRKQLIDEQGEVRSYGAFRDAVIKVDQEFNDHHLKVEYGSALAKAQMADKWQSLKQYPFLEYRTVGDNRVRKSHKELDGKVFASSDAIWDKIYPPNDWGCRCTVIPSKRGAVAVPDHQKGALVNGANVKPYFQSNVGKTMVVYKDDHPYFKNLDTQKQKELSAEKNYNLRSYESIKADPYLPVLKPMKDKEATQKWFEKKAKDGVLSVKTKDGLAVDLGYEFESKMINSSNSEYASRVGFAFKTPEIMSNPDEIWSNIHDGKLQTVYIKYYKDNPYAVMIKEDNGLMKFKSMYPLDRVGTLNFKRRGILKFRK